MPRNSDRLLDPLLLESLRLGGPFLTLSDRASWIAYGVNRHTRQRRDAPRQACDPSGRREFFAAQHRIKGLARRYLDLLLEYPKHRATIIEGFRRLREPYRVWLDSCGVTPGPLEISKPHLRLFHQRQREALGGQTRETGCPKCARAIPEAAHFCPWCGVKLGARATA